ncbi:putative speckle targeted PIP5K1A-regulated poly(A) polymerase [Apostichopus japonicus]|uniref:Putative speckle targeted PIP5K1A-regulated poly(A) polymerase n=1 Tax=Stichopus japonicus TaxID=307972 RepID=A0A2G8KMJ1_STIJA|nr:putative speckle targeted PIP5K1A-regulated poly(A) polymerase [Apostichopus japonicus]
MDYKAFQARKRKYKKWKLFRMLQTKTAESEYKKALNEATTELRRSKRQFERKLGDKIKEDTKSFYSFVRSKFKLGICHSSLEPVFKSFSFRFSTLSQSAYAIVEFTEKQSAANAVEEEKQTMNGLHIVVRPREVREFVSSGITQRNAALEGKKKKEDNLRLETQMLMAELVQKKTIDEQLFALSENISLSTSSLQIRYLICHLLQEVFSEFFANCRVFPYGSSVNSCGGNGSNLDIFLSLNWSDET